MTNVQHSSIYETLTLYRIVYASRFVFLSVLVLLASFVVQPIDSAFAAEEPVVAVETVVIEQPPEPEPEQEPEPAPEPQPEIAMETEVTPEPEPESEPESNEELTEAEESELVNETADAEPQIPVEPEAVTETDQPSEDVEQSDSESVEVSEEDSALESGSVALPASEVAESVASSTSEAVADAPAAPEAVATSTAVDTGAVVTSSEAAPTPTSGGESSSSDDAPATASEVATSTVAATDEVATTSTADTATAVVSTTPNQPAATSSAVTDTTEVVSVSEPEPEPESDTVADAAAEVATSTATTTAEVSEPDAPAGVDIAINDSNRHQFAESDCVSVGDGSFYCSKSSEAAAFAADGVFALPDADGDMEIFIRLNGQELQLTENQVDDASPYYDAESERIVWHRLVNDRYQIISYSIDEAAETVLTDTAYNNMEPVAYGEVTLWQAWIGNNWEVVRHDGELTEQLTSNEVHDVAPSMRGDYMLWQTQHADGWRVAVYDERKASLTYIDSTDSKGRVANPRFVLVFDQTDASGDTKTLGYDFDSGDTIDLGSLPMELPERLPEPDQTGEERALIQSKPATRDGDASGDLDGTDIDTNLQPEVDSEPLATTTAPVASDAEADVASSTIDMRPAAPVASSTDTGVAIPDVVVASSSEPVATQDADAVSHIEDVVVPTATVASST